MVDLTTQTLINTIPPAGHGMLNAVRGLVEAQADYTGLLTNPKTYVLGLLLWLLNWTLGWWANNVTIPTTNSPILKRFGYAVLVKVADITRHLPLIQGLERSDAQQGKGTSTTTTPEVPVPVIPTPTANEVLAAVSAGAGGDLGTKPDSKPEANV